MGQLAYIQFVGQSGQVDPGYGVPAPPPGAVQLPVFPFDPTRPDQGLPGGGGRPDQSLPGSQPHPDNTLPGQGARPDQGLPSHGHIDNGLPVPGKRYVVKWLACHGLILVPDQGLPMPSPPYPDQGLPGQSGRPDQSLPPTAQPKK